MREAWEWEGIVRRAQPSSGTGQKVRTTARKKGRGFFGFRTNTTICVPVCWRVYVYDIATTTNEHEKRDGRRPKGRGEGGRTRYFDSTAILQYCCCCITRNSIRVLVLLVLRVPHDDKIAHPPWEIFQAGLLNHGEGAERRAFYRGKMLDRDISQTPQYSLCVPPPPTAPSVVSEKLVRHTVSEIRPGAYGILLS